MVRSASRHDVRTGRARRLGALLAGAALLVAGLAAAAPATATAAAPTPAPAAAAAAAAAAGLSQVGDFGANPGGLNMYSYLPAGLPADAPLVVALHGCTQSAADYYANSGWPKYADLDGFALVLPEQPSQVSPIMKCFDWGTPSDDGRGQGEALSIYDMIQYAETTYHVDPSRIYVTGLSAGGGMAADLLADYPDVFAAGSIDSGPAAECSTSGITDTDCLSGTTDRTVAQWGSAIRDADSGYTGRYPRVAIWQGSADTTVNPAQLTYSLDGWTDVWGIGQTPSSTRTLTGGTTENSYDDATGRPAVETYSVAGMAHGLAVHPGSGPDQCGTTGTYYLDTICSSYYTAAFFGLDGTNPGPGPGPAAPTGLAVTGTTGSSASLSWNPVPGAVSYDVYRDGTLADSAPVTGTGYTDTGLAAGTTYGYTVASVDATGTVGDRSAPVDATTAGGAPCFTTDNYDQTLAGRAHQSGGYVYADGSDQPMGLWNVFTTHTLQQTGPDYYVIADGRC
ncbi:extracellular catalytic domain type 1 short-chain-length polyhydroxyalkanoate depolymerase [Kitasatospora sp. LaBMicrA B282]|uniref:extracellular catalytic domain type 1 short-chain-length polyhydroxyalkanoate depolymerase n=1 Tax=Kitasatospora sp. LaBMicrA B282 TaxID=3420949 RepID=UPI003D0F2650